MQLIRGKIPCAKKVTIYGPEGIGKSTIASKFPDPVFIDTEGSTKDMDVSRFEKASSWAMIMEQIRYVKMHPDICRTLVIDTADWAEQMCIEDLCARNGKKGIEDFGYGNGYVYAKEEFGRFLNLLEDVVEAGVNVVLTAHAHIKSFNQPDEMGSYDRWEMKLGKKTSSQTSPLVKEWSDMVLFANYKTMVYNVDGQGAQKGKNKVQGGKRVMYTSHHVCWDAKNRYGLPDEVDFDYSSIAHIIEPQGQKPTPEPAISKAVEAPIKPEPELRPAPQPKPEPEAKKEPVEAKAEPTPPTVIKVDERIPKALRDLMIANVVDEWDIQNVVAARGYFTTDVPVWRYDETKPGFIAGALVAAWEQVYEKIKEMKENDAIVFN